MPRHYHSATAFRAALETRLRNIALAQHGDLERLRRQVAFERLLARLFVTPDPPWLLKGGYAFELRLNQSARATKDIDLTIPVISHIAEEGDNPIFAVRERLQDEAERNLDDWFMFRIGAPKANLEAAPEGGARFPIETVLDGRTFVQFHLDVGIGDVEAPSPEWMTGFDVLAFAGIAPARIGVVPKEQQFAEKIHAYSLPRGERENTRVKDLVDLGLLLMLGMPDVNEVVRCIHATFALRHTHGIPKTLAFPPESWQAPFVALAQSCGVGDITLEDAHERLSSYWQILPR